MGLDEDASQRGQDRLVSLTAGPSNCNLDDDVAGHKWRRVPKVDPPPKNTLHVFVVSPRPEESVPIGPEKEGLDPIPKGGISNARLWRP